MANNEKMNISYTIRAIDNFSKVHDKLEKQLSRIGDSFKDVQSNDTLNIDTNAGDVGDKMERISDTTKKLSKKGLDMKIPSKFENKLVKLEADLRVLQGMDFEMDVQAKDAMRDIKRIRKTFDKLGKEIEIEIESDTEDAQKNVGALTDQLNELNRMRKRVAKTETELKTELDLNTDKFYSKLKGIQVDLSLIPDIKIDSEVNAKKAIKNIDSLDAKIKRLTKEVNIELKADTKRSKREVNSLNEALTRTKRRAKELDGLRAEVTAQVDSAGFFQEIADAEDEVDRFPRRVTTKLSLEYQGFRKNIDRMADSMRDFSEVSQRIGIGGIFTALPALVPILGSAIGGVGALASALTSAGIGAAGFAAVAVPAITDVFDASSELAKVEEELANASNAEERAAALSKLAEVQSQYNKEQWESVKALQSFKSFFDKFAKQFEKPILKMFNQSLGILQSLLEMSQPAIEGMVTAVGNLFSKFEQTLNTQEMEDFFAWVGRTAGPNFEKLVTAVGNFLLGFVNMMIAFDPLAQSFMDGFLNMARDFREWSKTLSESQAFQDFINYVRENGPTVLKLIGKIVTTIWNLGVAMAPLGTAVLNVLTAFFAWTSELFKNHKWVGMLVGIVSVLMGAFMSLWPIIIMGATVFKILGPAIKVVFGWIGKLGGVISKVIPWVGRLGKFLLRFLGPVGAVASIVMMLADVFNISWSQIANITSMVWNALPGIITGPLETIWNGVTSVFGGIAEFIGLKGDEMSTNVSEDLTSMQTDFSTKLPQMNSTVGTNFGSMYGTTNMYSGMMANTTSTNMVSVKDNFYSNLTTADSTVTSKFTNMNSTVGTNMTSMYGTTAADLGLMSTEFDTNLSTMGLTTSTEFGAMDSTVSEYMNQMNSTTAADLGLMETDFSTSTAGMKSDVLSNFSGMSGNVDSFMSDIESDVGTSWGGAESDTGSSLNGMTIATATEYQKIVKTVFNSMDVIETEITSTMSSIVSYLEGINLHSTGSNMIQGMINGVNSKRSGLISAVSSAANAAVRAANSRLQIHSPSRVFREIGEFTGQGFIVGLANMTPKISQASGRMADAAIPNAVRVEQPKFVGARKPAPAVNDQYGATRRNEGATFGESSPIIVQKMEVREEADIKKIARELYDLQRRRNRGGGFA